MEGTGDPLAHGYIGPIESGIESSGAERREVSKGKQENELKYWALALPSNLALNELEHEEIEDQQYLAEGTEIRLFKKGGQFFQEVTHPDPSHCVSQVLFSMEEEQFNRLWAATEGMEGDTERFVPAGATKRIRKEGGRLIQNIKISVEHDGVGKSEMEYEAEIGSLEFLLLQGVARDRRINKTRYFLPLGEWVMAIDVYKGELEGLVTVEVEAEEDQALEKFSLPEEFRGILIDVSKDKAFGNKSLAKLSREDLTAMFENKWEERGKWIGYDKSETI